jgi:hypothetical protein
MPEHKARGRLLWLSINGIMRERKHTLGVEVEPLAMAGVALAFFRSFFLGPVSKAGLVDSETNKAETTYPT